MGKVVGIDLGTTNSVVSVMEGGKPIVVANAEGMRTTPSVVAFSKEGELLVGQMARRQTVLNPQNTFFGVKRYIGRRYSELNSDSKRVPYTLRRDERGNVKIKCPRMEKDYAPEEIAAMILRKLAEEASRYLGEPVTGAVITVPAYFDDSQRQATRDAGRIAGLEVKRIINEPTAASLAYGLEQGRSQTILVFDLGGGTFDVSILDVGDGVFEVRATAGDTQLGGTDFDKKIVDWLADQFLEQENIDLRRDRQSLQRLTEAAEKAKIELSGVSVTEINLPFITATPDGPKHLETKLTRSQFEGLCTDLISRLRGPVKQAVRDAGLYPEDIDEVVLVGGSTRMPMVKDLVRSFIDREPNEHVNPDEVVAVGAAIQAGILTQEVRDILLLDVTPLSLGLETIGGVTKKLIPRNTTIPVRRSDIFSTAENNQTMVEVHALQGEREMAADNKSLGRFKLMGIPPAPRGVPQVQVSFDIDANGILQVTAVDKTTGREQGITIQGASVLSDSEVQRMLQEAEQFAQKDRERRERVEKRTRAEALTYQSERQLREVALDFGMQFASDYRRRIENLIQELRDALSKDDERRIDVAEADLRDALYDLQQEVYNMNQQEEEGGILGTIKRTLLGDDDDDDFFYRSDRDYAPSPRYEDSWSGRDRRDPYDRRDSWDNRPAARRPAPDYGRSSGGWDDDWGAPAGGRDRRDVWSEPPPPPSNRNGRRDEGRGTRRPAPGQEGWDVPPSRPAARQDNWDAPRPAPRQPDSWDAPRPAPRQQDSWDAPRPAARQDSWDAPRPAPRQPDSWDAPRPAPRQQDSWDAPRPAARQDNWDAPRPATRRDNGDAPRPAPRQQDSWDEGWDTSPRDRPSRRDTRMDDRRSSRMEDRASDLIDDPWATPKSDRPTTPPPVENREAPRPAAPPPADDWDPSRSALPPLADDWDAPLPKTPPPVEDDWDRPRSPAPAPVDDWDAPRPSAPAPVDDWDRPRPAVPPPADDWDAPRPSSRERSGKRDRPTARRRPPANDPARYGQSRGEWDDEDDWV